MTNMKKHDEEQKVVYELDDFEKQCHLWSIVPGGSGKGIIKLRKIIDSIQSENYTNPYKQLPSFLLAGESGTGKNLVAKAITNSLILTDVRECDARYVDNGIQSSTLFRDSLLETALIIANIENLTMVAESVIWRYLHHGTCKYYNYLTKQYDIVQNCNGMVVLTARDKSKIAESILSAVDHVIELEPYTVEQQKLIVHQQLRFCSVNYVGGETVLEEIVNQGVGQIGMVLDFLKVCLITMRADMLDCLNLEVIEKAKRIWGSNAPIGAPPMPDQTDDIPF
jgi:AAA+ superfamily predicted ATPase